MVRRVGIWLGVGIAVTAFWIVFTFMVRVNLKDSLVLAITAPPSILGQHRPMTVYEFALENIALYGLLGLMTTLVWRPKR
jgi:hypothetical protein